MSIAVRLFVIALLSLVAIYTVSYGVWVFKRKNRLGAVMVFVVALVTLVLPVFVVFFKD